MQSLFQDNFPLVSNNIELEALKKKYPKYDPYYVASGAIEKRKKLFDDLYNKYYLYADRHFLSEVKKQFHQRTWEMYVGCSLIENKVIFSSKDKGPDILIEKDNRRIWIECVAADKGDTEDRVPQIQEGFQALPHDEMLIRLANSLFSKFEKYKKYKKDKLVSNNDYYIIAVNTGILDFPGAEIPLIFKCLFALGSMTLSIPLGGGPSSNGWSKKDFISKKNGSPVPMDFFLKQEHAGISGVIYCHKTILNHSEPIGDDLLLVHNPFAVNQLPLDVFNFIVQYHDLTNQGNLEKLDKRLSNISC